MKKSSVNVINKGSTVKFYNLGPPENENVKNIETMPIAVKMVKKANTSYASVWLRPCSQFCKKCLQWHNENTN